MCRIAVMQPYLFPYIGYFQLIDAVDTFVFYDDVSFIKNGWINRNRILINGHSKYFTIPCKNISSHTDIIDIQHGLNGILKKKLLKKIEYSYRKAPHFGDVYEITEQVLNRKTRYISDLAIASVKCAADYLGIKVNFIRSSNHFDNRHLNAADRLVDICRQQQVNTYINAANGKKLYDKRYFKRKGIDIQFIEHEIIEYKQFNQDFIPGLSIIDVMMFNTPEIIKDKLLPSYHLV